MLCRIAQWDWGHVAYATGLEFVPQNSPIMHFNTTPTQSQPPSLCFKARLSAKLLILMQINHIFTRRVLHLASFLK